MITTTALLSPIPRHMLFSMAILLPHHAPLPAWLQRSILSLACDMARGMVYLHLQRVCHGGKCQPDFLFFLLPSSTQSCCLFSCVVLILLSAKRLPRVRGMPALLAPEVAATCAICTALSSICSTQHLHGAAAALRPSLMQSSQDSLKTLWSLPPLLYILSQTSNARMCSCAHTQRRDLIAPAYVQRCGLLILHVSQPLFLTGVATSAGLAWS